MNDKQQKPKGKAITIKTTTTPPTKADVRVQNDLARRISPEYLALLNAIVKEKENGTKEDL